MRFLSQGSSSDKVQLLQAPRGSCCCDNRSCIPRPDCVKEGGKITLEFHSNATGYAFKSPDGDGAYKVFDGQDSGALAAGNTVRLFARLGPGASLQEVRVLSTEDNFRLTQLRRGAAEVHAGAGVKADPPWCTDPDILSVGCAGISVCCGKRCQGVCKNCKAASEPEGGYCMCYPVGYYSDGKHVQRDGACVLPPGERGDSIPKVDVHQPDSIRSSKLHSGGGLGKEDL